MSILCRSFGIWRLTEQLDSLIYRAAHWSITHWHYSSFHVDALISMPAHSSIKNASNIFFTGLSSCKQFSIFDVIFPFTVLIAGSFEKSNLNISPLLLVTSITLCRCAPLRTSSTSQGILQRNRKQVTCEPPRRTVILSLTLNFL